VWHDPSVKLATIRTPHGTRAARVEDDHLVELGADDVGALLRGSPDALERAAGVNGPSHPLDGADYAPLVLDPGKIVCVGVNYADHIAEMGREPPAYPTLFAKFTDALIGAHDDIVLPVASDATDWECELTLVIGTPARHATVEQAASAIAGFTVANDVSMRDWQRRTEQWLQGKTWEHATPLGPWLVTPDEVGGTAPDLELVCEVDGVEMQRSHTGLLVFGPAAIVAYVSTILTLRPGDAILTGTPAGVGFARTPPIFLQPGQVVTSRIENVGELRNRCVAEAP
jgi:acylpyruvate hydrolase